MKFDQVIKRIKKDGIKIPKIKKNTTFDDGGFTDQGPTGLVGGADELKKAKSNKKKGKDSNI